MTSRSGMERGCDILPTPSLVARPSLCCPSPRTWPGVNKLGPSRDTQVIAYQAGEAPAFGSVLPCFNSRCLPNGDERRWCLPSITHSKGVSQLLVVFQGGRRGQHGQRQSLFCLVWMKPSLWGRGELAGYITSKEERRRKKQGQPFFPSHNDSLRR